MFSIYKLVLVYKQLLDYDDNSVLPRRITHTDHFNSFDGANRFMHSIKSNERCVILSVSIKLIIVQE